MRILLLIFIYCGSLFAIDATLDVVKTVQKIPNAEVSYSDSKNSEQAQKIYKILMTDLKISGHFEVFDGDKFKGDSIDYVPYKNKKIDLLIRIEVRNDANGMKAIMYLYDINSSEFKISKIYTISNEALYPFAAHKMAININDYIKAPSIAWMNRFIVLSKYVGSGLADIIVSDYTLTYQKVIVKGGLNIFPKWADANQTEIYYTKYFEKPTIVKYNIYTGLSQNIIQSDGMAIVSDVSKDGSKLLLSLAPETQSDIFLYNLNTKKTTQLTKYPGIDVSGNFIDNDTAMIFISDRVGYPNVFAKKLDIYAPVEQVVYHGRNNSSASAYGDYVVYTSRETANEFGLNTFNLYLISTKSDYIRRLTANGTNQMPRFSSDGGSIMFLKHTQNQSALGIIRLDYNRSYLFPLNNIKIQAFDW
ncbi:translocation protein TolB [Helicobacter sp. 12S02232-10]|uniref:Tol-Pal system protein TolB n=1 Tax=Helicobacter sp. 12S02232-10 TaxID=1476197 RepID=UPI000BA687FC|nr:Tol-Pal system protein TolB [Helicobacter sp. 12S02232-10]PAF49893.1 translocation protein TolB [Helicobacter sp. 12S02232-10]